MAFRIRDDKSNTIFDDVSSLQVFSMYKDEEKMHLYVDVNSLTINI
jgi:hypothetical protein